MTVIDEIKVRVDIVDLVSETVQLRRSGKNYTGFCPFHSNTRTPAFVVFSESGTWRCFGQCNEGGDIFGYIMKREGWDFTEALRFLAERAGVQLKPITPKEQAEVEEHDRLRSLLEEAVTFYRHHLVGAPGGAPAAQYLNKRGIKNETMEAFEVGYAPQGWDAALNYFKEKGYTEQELLDAGMLSTREESGSVYDRFRHRIIFPIRDERGRMSGFGARILNPDDVPKFLNSPQSAVFDKGHLLYGLNRARKAIRETDQVVIVEGYLDVIALHQAGFENVVSPMGTALTEHQLFLLKRYTRRIVLALDPDAAGDKATLRGLQIARQTLDRETELAFDARGLLRHEARLQADIRVTTLPPGMDPDDVVNRDKAEWEQILANARPVVVHVMETLAAGRDLDDAKVKSEIAGQVLPLIEDVPDAIERDTYRQRLARLLRIDERVLYQGATGRAQPRPTRRSQTRAERGLQPGEQSAETAPRYAGEVFQRLEGHCLGLLMRRPDLLYKVDRKLQDEGLARLSVEDFHREDHKTIFRLIYQSIDQDEVEPLDYILNRLSLPLMDIADALLARTEKMNPSDDDVLEDLMRGVVSLRSRDLRQNIDHLRFLMETAQEEGDLLVSEFRQGMVHYITAKKRLDIALGKYTDRSFNLTSRGTGTR